MKTARRLLQNHYDIREAVKHLRMTITLTPEQQQIVDEQLKLGRYRTPEDVVADAFRALSTADQHAGNIGAGQQDAVLDMLSFAENNRTILTGVSVKELIHGFSTW